MPDSKPSGVNEVADIEMLPRNNNGNIGYESRAQRFVVAGVATALILILVYSINTMYLHVY